jgi:DnaJ-class molecular chaperone
MTDHYTVLGISKNATDDEIKSAYRKLARTHHPDKGGNKEQFQKIQQAYETLSDPNKRQQYDNPHNMQNDMFNSFFNMNPFHQQQNARSKKGDHHYTCKVSLKDVYYGITKKFKVQRSRICVVCKQNCNTCNGSGHITKHLQMGPFTQIVHQSCNICHGAGISRKNGGCNNCKNGAINEETIFEVVVKKGIQSGTNFVLEGWGEQAVRENEDSGDFIVNILVDQDPNFTRIGNDLIYNVNLTLRESITGKIIKIPHFEGELNVDTKGFGIINPDKEYIIFSKGIQAENSASGNLCLRFKITYAEKTFSENEIRILNDTFNLINFK